MAQPWESPVSKFTKGFLGGYNTVSQAIAQRQQMENEQAKEKFGMGVNMLAQARQLANDYKDNPALMEQVVSPMFAKGLVMLTGDEKYGQMKYNYHPKDNKFMKMIADSAEFAYRYNQPDIFSQLNSKLMEKWGEDTTDEERKQTESMQKQLDRQKEEAAGKYVAEYRGLLGRGNDPAYRTEEASMGIEDYKRENLMPVIQQLSPKLSENLVKQEGKGEPVKLLNDVSRAFFGRPYEQLSQYEQREALNRYADVQGGVSAAKTTGSAEANLDQPLGKDAMYYFDPNTLARIRPSVTRRAAQKNGAIIAKPDEIEKINDIDKTNGILIQIQEGAKRVITAKDKPSASAQLAYSKLPTFIQDAQNKRYLETLDAYLGNVARTLGGERGVLTDQDLARQKNGLPRPGDTVKVRDAKIAMQQSFLEVAQQAAKAKLLGVEFNEEEYRKKINKILDKMDSSGIGPSSYTQAFKDIKAANPKATDKEINEYIKKNYPELMRK